MRKRTTLGVLSIFMLLLASAAQASLITLHGSDVDGTASEWRTAGSVTKPADVGGDNIYGTNGYVTWLPDESTFALPSTVRVGSPPSYVTNFNEVATQATRWSSYIMIDDPINPSTDVRSGTLTISGVADSANLLTFEINSGIASIDYFVFGVMADNLNHIKYVPASFTLTGSGGGSCTVNVTPNLNPDFFFFKVKNAQVGEVFTLSGTKSSIGYVTAAAVTWDNVAVPEPSVLMLLLGGLALLIFCRTKK